MEGFCYYFCLIIFCYSMRFGVKYFVPSIQKCRGVGSMSRVHWISRSFLSPANWMFRNYLLPHRPLFSICSCTIILSSRSTENYGVGAIIIIPGYSKASVYLSEGSYTRFQARMSTCCLVTKGISDATEGHLKCNFKYPKTRITFVIFPSVFPRGATHTWRNRF
jgi:hypothetical protein